MRHSHHGSFRDHASLLRRQFLQDGDLPFANVLTEDVIAQALATLGGWLDRIFSPLVTMWVFLGQVLSPDHSCRVAVARLIAHRVSRGQSPCSAQTGAYCQARKRLPERFFSDVARRTGRALHDGADPQWLWKGRRVYIYDGSVVSMPDTPENQREYPQPDTQKPGLGFPLARIAAVFSLACGAVLNLGICRYAGKGQSELGMLRALWDLFRPGDVLLADRLMCAWTEMVILKQRGVDSVTRLSKRGPTSAAARVWAPATTSSSGPSRGSRARSIGKPTTRCPSSLTVRERRVRIEQVGFRSRAVIVVTTLLDADAFTGEDLAQLYRARWNAELDLRSLKRTLQMDVLRCKTPDLVRKEIWTHLLAYNLIRTVMAQAATRHGIEPRSISFKGAVQTLDAFRPMIARQDEQDPEFRTHVYQQILDAIATHRVADRPDRFEPRLRKRRPKHYAFLRKPRGETKRAMLNAFSKN